MIALVCALLAGMLQEPVSFTKAERRAVLSLSPLASPPADPTNRVADDPEAARLGQRLFFEERFSKTEDVSCATCHDPARAFTDGKPLAETLGTSTRHTPHLWNLAWSRWFFWDGRADSLWAQAAGPIENPIEMGGSRLRLAKVVLEDETLRPAMESVFGALPDVGLPDGDARPGTEAWDALDEETQRLTTQVLVDVGKALAAYERRLVSQNSPFDQFVLRMREGEPLGADLLNVSAQRGLKLFIGKGQCMMCHHGPNFTDGEFHGLRLPVRGGGFPKDAGRFEGVSRLESSELRADGIYSDASDGERARRSQRLRRSPATWGEFKTPSLRHVARTAPYMHQGQFATLREVLKFYSTLEGATSAGHHQEILLTPRDFTDQEIDDLIAFLESLTGAPLPESLLTAPSD
ncbi:MAG: cytochrome c peroxidase [Planctomycetota bacterium]